jgi:xanthine dehydrogenase accessory factor
MNLLHDNALVDKTAGVDRMLSELRAGRSLVAVTAVTRDGLGHRLLLGPDGAVLGGAEGGLLECRAAAALGELPAAGWSAVLREADPLGRLEGDAAAVYGGVKRLVFERMAPEAADLDLLTALARALAEGRSGLLVTRLGEVQTGRCLLLPGGVSLGQALPGDVLAEAARLWPGLAGPMVLDLAGTGYLLDCYRPMPPIFLAGAGMISRRVAPLAAQAGFRVLVLDTDPAFANRERFPLADAVCLVPEFGDCFAGRDVDDHASVVVVTRGHAYDIEVLAQALATPAGYVGLMACKADGRARLDSLGRQGFSEETLARVHTPIGLPIGGKTPDEVAISIMAEIIAARSARKKAGGC